jgi:hypothetical protein
MQYRPVGEPSPTSQAEKDRHTPMGCHHNLDDAWIVIDGERYDVIDLLRLVVKQLKK